MVGPGGPAGTGPGGRVAGRRRPLVHGREGPGARKPPVGPLGADQEAGGPVTHPPASEAASGAVRAPGAAPGAKPSLQDRLRALESKHGTAAALGREPTQDLTEPRRSGDQDDAAPADMGEAVANVR